MNRRDFLITASAAGIGAALPWSQARSARGERLRLAMIGTGMRGQSQLGPLLSLSMVGGMLAVAVECPDVDALGSCRTTPRTNQEVHGQFHRM